MKSVLKLYWYGFLLCVGFFFFMLIWWMIDPSISTARLPKEGQVQEESRTFAKLVYDKIIVGEE